MKRRVLTLGIPAVLLSLAIAGCDGSSRLAKVGGVVTLNGKPRPGVVVSFAPIGSQENPNPGRSSSAVTDENGHFALMTDEGKDGAVVGKHRVRIFSQWDNSSGAFAATETGTPDGVLGAVEKVAVDPIPTEWNADSAKEFVVPPEGTDQANFDITTRR
jgi:hypothetical protein